MNAPLSNDELASFMPAAVRGRDATAARIALARGSYKSPVSTAFRAIVNGVTYALTFPRRWATISALNTLSDRELADIGLARGDISGIYGLRHPRRR